MIIVKDSGFCDNLDFIENVQLEYLCLFMAVPSLRYPVSAGICPIFFQGEVLVVR